MGKQREFAWKLPSNLWTKWVIFALYQAILHSYWAVYVQYWMIWHLTSNSFTKWVIFALYWVILHSYEHFLLVLSQFKEFTHFLSQFNKCRKLRVFCVNFLPWNLQSCKFFDKSQVWVDHHYIHFSILREKQSVLLETINTQINLKQVPPSKLVQRRWNLTNIMR